MGKPLEASKGGMKAGRIKDPLYKVPYFGITPPTFIPPFKAPETLNQESLEKRRGQGKLKPLCAAQQRCDRRRLQARRPSFGGFG